MFASAGRRKKPPPPTILSLHQLKSNSLKTPERRKIYKMRMFRMQKSKVAHHEFKFRAEFSDSVLSAVCAFVFLLLPSVPWTSSVPSWKIQGFPLGVVCLSTNAVTVFPVFPPNWNCGAGSSTTRSKSASTNIRPDKNNSEWGGGGAGVNVLCVGFSFCATRGRKHDDDEGQFLFWCRRHLIFRVWWTSLQLDVGRHSSLTEGPNDNTNENIKCLQSSRSSFYELCPCATMHNLRAEVQNIIVRDHDRWLGDAIQ